MAQKLVASFGTFSERKCTMALVLRILRRCQRRRYQSFLRSSKKKKEMQCIIREVTQKCLFLGDSLKIILKSLVFRIYFRNFALI